MLIDKEEYKKLKKEGKIKQRQTISLSEFIKLAKQKPKKILIKEAKKILKKLNESF